MCSLSDPNPIHLVLAAALLALALLPRRFGLRIPLWLRGLLALGAAIAGLLAVRCGTSQPPPPPPLSCAAALASQTPSAEPSPVALVQSPSAPSAAAAASAAAPPPLGLTTGPKGLTYYRMGQDLKLLASRAADGDKALDILLLETAGTLDNIRRLAGPDNAGVGFTQSDVLQYLPHSADAQLLSKVGRLRLVMPLHSEEVHVLARRDPAIRSMADLAGRRLLTPSSSQGAKVTASNLIRLLNLGSVQLDDSRDLPQAVCDVVEGRADALVITAGQPTPMLQALGRLTAAQRASFQLLPITGPVPEGYAAAQITQYLWQPTPVQTLSVRALLISYDFSRRRTPYERARCDDVRRLKDLLRSQLGGLRQPPSHPKWAEVESGLPVPGWLDDRC